MAITAPRVAAALQPRVEELLELHDVWLCQSSTDRKSSRDEGAIALEHELAVVVVQHAGRGHVGLALLALLATEEELAPSTHGWQICEAPQAHRNVGTVRTGAHVSNRFEQVGSHLSACQPRTAQHVAVQIYLAVIRAAVCQTPR
jgi:hypothetical protein